MQVVTIVDLDTPVYKACAATEKRSIEVLHKSGATKEFNTRTEFKELLKSKNKLDRIDEYEIKDIQVAEPVEHSCQILKNLISRIIEDTAPDKTIFLISGSTNFRNDLELPTKYKSSRTGIRPLNLKEVQEWAKVKYKALVSVNEEPDDSQIWVGYQELAKGNKPIIVTIDKDSKSYSGLWLYNPDKAELGSVLIPGLGEIVIDSKNKVRATGFMNYALQCLVGDTTDSYRPNELAGSSFGEKTAYKLLKDCTSEKEILEQVLQQYKKWYPEPFVYKAWDGTEIQSDWKHMLCLYHKCVRMKETPNDPLDAVEFYKRYGVEL